MRAALAAATEGPLHLRGGGGTALSGVVFSLASLGRTFPLLAALLFQAAAWGHAAGGRPSSWRTPPGRARC